MRIGVCGEITEAAAFGAAGFDHIEMPAKSLSLDGCEREAARRAGVILLATNLFFGDGIRLFGPEKTAYLPYARSVIERAASLGIGTMVIGSGGARRAEAGEGDDAAFARIAAEIGEIARPLGITIAPESLRREETNVGNDCGAFARALRSEGVAWTLDTYHAIAEWDRAGTLGDPAAMWREAIPHAPVHLHLSSRDRRAPDPADPLLLGALARLRELGYAGDASLECVRDGWDAERAADDARRLVRRAGF